MISMNDLLTKTMVNLIKQKPGIEDSQQLQKDNQQLKNELKSGSIT